MRVGMILDKGFPPDPRVQNEAKTLIENGFDVHLLVLDNKATIEFEIIDGIKVSRKKISKLDYKLSALAYTFPFYHWRTKKKIKRFLVERKIDLVHIHDLTIARSVYWANNDLKLPVTLDLHENRPEIMRYYRHVNTRLGKLLISIKRWKYFEKRAIKKSSQVVVVTNAAMDYYVNTYKIDERKFTILPNTVTKDFYSDVEIFEDEAGTEKKAFNLLYLGDTSKRRGLLTIFNGVLELKEKIPEIKLVVIGTSNEDYLLKEFIKENNLEEYIKLEGFKDFGLFPSYISAADIGLCPFYRNIHHNTTFANKMFQYMSLGKPIIVSNCDAQERVVKEYNCGLVYQDKSSEGFASAVLKLYNDPKLYNNLSINSKMAIKNHFNWEKTSSEFINLYNNFKNA